MYFPAYNKRDRVQKSSGHTKLTPGKKNTHKVNCRLQLFERIPLRNYVLVSQCYFTKKIKVTVINDETCASAKKCDMWGQKKQVLNTSRPLD